MWPVPGVTFTFSVGARVLHQLHSWHGWLTALLEEVGRKRNIVGALKKV